MIVCKPNAKINLGLNIVARRDDGYHNIETTMCPIKLCDKLQIEEDDHTSLEIKGLSIAGNIEDNLIIKVVRYMQQQFGVPQLQVMLTKNIPMGAGLGGGSSDAAFTLSQINKLFNLKLNNDNLAKIAALFGSDCAFFINNSPAIASGRGDILRPANISLYDYHVIVISPDIYISTAEAYAGCHPDPWATPLEKVLEQPIDTWRTDLRNDFEPQAFSAHPELAEIKQMLYNIGATYASMSGSGSSMYGIFSQLPTLEAIDKALSTILSGIKYSVFAD